MARALFILVLIVLAGAAPFAAQAPRDSLTLSRQMREYSVARQFHDVQALGSLVHEKLLGPLEESLPSLHRAFRARFPTTSPDRDDELRAFLSERNPTDSASPEVLRAFGTAFRILDAQGSVRDAAVALLAEGLLPPENVSVDSSRAQFARWDGEAAVYYLTEVWTLLGTLSVTKRFVVRWERAAKGWGISDVR
jgi:hypothetical protein